MSECVLRKLRKFHVLKVFELRRVLFPCCHCWCAHVTRVVTWKQGRGTSQHAIIATYHRSVKQWKVFIDLESIVFSGSTRLLWIRVSPGSSSGIAGQNYIHADPKWHSCRNGTDFNTLISQSNFCIFHNTTQSVIITFYTSPTSLYQYRKLQTT